LNVLAMYALARRLIAKSPSSLGGKASRFSPSPACGGGQGGGVLMAAIAAVFPLYAVSYGVRARIYPLVLLFIVLCFLLAIRLMFPAPALRKGLPPPFTGEGRGGRAGSRRGYAWGVIA